MEVIYEEEVQGERDTWGIVVVLERWTSDVMSVGGTSEGEYVQSTYASTVHVV